MTAIIIAVGIVILVVVLAVWISGGREAFGPDTGTDDDPKPFPSRREELE
ncbi:MAG: hypothetical protein ACR2N9_05305 [Acidimicrobiia bacterium]